MIPYLITFLISIIFFGISDYYSLKEKNIKCLVFIIIGIIPLCILACLRDTSIGVDVSFYALPTYIKAKNIQMTKFLSLFEKEPLYYLMVYICANYFKSFSSLLFFNEALILLPLGIAIYKYRKKLNISLAMFIYMFVFYNASFCYMRQYIACSFIVLATYYLLNKENRKFIILFVIATGFHSSSIISMILVFLCCKCFKTRRQKIVFFVVVCISLVCYSYIMPLIIDAGLLKEEYYTRFLGTIEVSSNYAELLLYICMITPFFMMRYDDYKDVKNEYILVAMLMILFIVASAVLSKYLYRFSMYFRYFIVLLLPISMHGLFKKTSNRKIISLYAMSVAIVHFIWFVTIINTEKTYPYLFLK